MDRHLTAELFRRIACSESSLEEFDEMLEKFPREATIVDGFGFPAINSAAMHGNQSAIRSLLAHGADPHTRDPNSHTPLMIALRGHSEGFARSVSAIIDASIQGEDDGGSCSNRKWLNLTDNQEMTVLHFAARAGDADAVERLVALGADLESRDRRRRTPLHYASLKARFRAVQALLNLGAKVDVTDGEGNTPALACALELAHVQQAAQRRRLSSVGDVTCIGTATSPAALLGLSAEEKREEDWRRAVVEVLLAAGAAKERCNKWGQSLVVLAKRQRWLRVAVDGDDSSSQDSDGSGGVRRLRTQSLNVPQLRSARRRRGTDGTAPSSSVQELPRSHLARNTPTPLRDSSVEDEAFEQAPPTPELERPAAVDENADGGDAGTEGKAVKKATISWPEIKHTAKMILLFVACRYLAFKFVGWYYADNEEVAS